MSHPSSLRPEPDDFQRFLIGDAVTRFDLDNGLVVVHSEEARSGLVSVQLWVKTGSIHEGELVGAGISHYLEHMLFKGTERRPDGAIAREVLELGGYINAYTTFDRTVYYIDLPAEHFAAGIDILADMASSTLLKSAELEKEREVILREISMGLDDPDRQISQALFRTAFRVHPYRHPVIGHRDLFSRLSLEDLQSYYRRRYQPGNSVLVVTGAVSEIRLRDAIDNSFGKIVSGVSAPVIVPVEPRQLARREVRIVSDVNICRGALGFRIPGLAHHDAPALDLFATILGNGQSSVLWQSLRENQQLVHTVSAAAWNPGEAGLFFIDYTCDCDKREAVEAAILQELKMLASVGVGEEQLEKARRIALVGEVNARKTVSGEASRLGLAEVVIGDLGYPRRYLEKITSIKADEIPELIKEYLVEDHLTVASINAPGADSHRRTPVKRLSELTEFETKTLENGARLVWQRDDRLPKVHLRLAGLGGPLYEPVGQRGVTSLMTTMLTRDTRWKRAFEVAGEIESVGGSFSEYTGNNSFGITLEVLSSDLKLAKSLMEDAVLSPQFREATFNREKAALIADIRESADDVVELGRRLHRRQFFGDHPFAIEAEGTEESVEGLTLDAIRAHYDRLMVSSNLVMAVVGDIDPDRDLPELETLLLDLPAWSFRKIMRPFEISAPAADTFEIQREQTVAFLSYLDCGVCGSEDLAGQVVDSVCSDMASQLFQTIREERGLAYFVSTGRTLGLNTGQFTFYAGTQPESAEEVLKLMADEAERLRVGGPSEAELQRARTRLKARLRMGRQSLGARATHASLHSLYGLPLNDAKDYDVKLNALTIEDVRAFCARFRSDRSISLRVGPVK